MNIKKYFELSNQKLEELENSYSFIPNEYEIETIGLSIDRSCLRQTARIARLHAQKRRSETQEKILLEKREQAIRRKFIRPGKSPSQS